MTFMNDQPLFNGPLSSILKNRQVQSQFHWSLPAPLRFDTKANVAPSVSIASSFQKQSKLRRVLPLKLKLIEYPSL